MAKSMRCVGDEGSNVRDLTRDCDVCSTGNSERDQSAVQRANTYSKLSSSERCY